MVKRTTIVDIAREAKVSVSTVSKALMDAPDISYKTKCLIRKTAEELGYVYNSKEEKACIDFLNIVRNLPKDAKEIGKKNDDFLL